MFPSKFKLERIIKNRTINFETVKKTHGNLVFIATEDEKDMNKVLGSKLFRPQQMMSSFVPRIIKPMNKKVLRLDQKDIYSNLKIGTSGKIKIGKLMSSAYNGRNLTYNIIPEYRETTKAARSVKGESKLLQDYMTGYFEDLISSKIEELNYEKAYLVFPMNEYVENFKEKVFTKIDVVGPLILFLKSMRKETIDLSKYAGIDKVIFINQNANALVMIDLKTFDFKNFMDVFLKISRLNNFNDNKDALTTDVIDEEELDEEDDVENTKEEIKNVVLRKFAKTLKADKLDDFEAADKDEKDLILSIDRRIDSYLSKKENIDKPFDELVSDVEQDSEVKVKALKFIETKKIADQKLAQLSRNLQKEVEVLDSIEDLTSEIETLEPDTFEVEGVDERVKSSTLSNLDEEYNKKQAMKDLKAIVSSFSESVYLPLTVDSFSMNDGSDDFNQINTVSIRYKTDEGRSLSFSLDLPKIVDKRYFYLGGNKKVLTKQLFRLPIVKTKPDRVEITTNFNKVTIERTNGKLSRKNAYLLKLLGNYKLNKNITIEYGANGIVNANYKNDFEYEELSESLTKIESPKYKIIFNRQDIESEISLLELPEDYIKDNMTPIGFNKITGSLLFIRDEKIYSATVSGEKPIEDLVSNTLFNFLYVDVLERTDADRLPQIGKSFIYTKMSILGTSYPIFAVVGMLNGITDILKRYKVDYKVVDEKISRNAEYVEVKFKDKFLYYKDNVKNTLLLNVLFMMNTEEYDYAEFDLDQPYLDFFIHKLDQPIYIKNTLKINTNILIDPITKNVLNDLKLPTNIIDLLLLANTMLMNNSYRPQNDVRNYRIRGNEIVFAMMYQIIAEAYIKYQRARLNGRDAASFDIPKNILISRLLTEPNVNDHSTLNPVKLLLD